jgi:hypothetical protein
MLAGKLPLPEAEMVELLLSFEHDRQWHPSPLSARRRLRIPMSHIFDLRRPLVSSFFPNR